VEEGATEVGSAILTAVTNTIISFIPVFALTDQEGKLFTPLAYTKSFAIAASVILALTLVPVLCYYLLKPTRWSRMRSSVVGVAIGAAAALVTQFAMMRSDLVSGHLSGWPFSTAVGIMVAAAVFRMGQEKLLPLEQNVVSRVIIALYQPALRWVLAHKLAFLSIPTAIAVLGLMIWLGFPQIAAPAEKAAAALGWQIEDTLAWQRMREAFPGIGREFMPPLDEGSFLYMPSLLPAASLSQAQQIIAKQNAAIREVPEVASVVGKIGRAESALDPAPIGMIETIILLKPEAEWRQVTEDNGKTRRLTKDEVLGELQAKTAIPGVLPTWLQPIQARLVMLQTGFRAMMGVKIFGSDPAEIERIGLQMEPILRSVSGATDVVADRLIGKPYIEFEINREAAARYGVNIRDVQDVIEIGIGGENLTTSVEGRERYPIRVRYLRELRDNFEDLKRILVPTSDGNHIPIAQVTEISYSIGPQELKSENGLLVGYVTLNTRQRDEISVVEDAERLLQESKSTSDELIAAGRHNEATLVVPPGYYWEWAGQFENQRRATQRLSWLVPIVLLLMFVMLYLGLGRWWLSLVVFFGIVVSAAGGFIMLYLWGVNLSVAVWVGFIALFGVVDDSSVVMLDFLERRFRGRTPESIAQIREWVIDAGVQRVRPLLMSTATTVFGLMPVFWTHGRGSDVMQPMAIPVVGGMAVQLITLFIAPCIYCLVQESGVKRRLRKSAQHVQRDVR
jgi:Cu(I)/Ag(I) efflux system membrane protein CusA/SilA